MILSMVESPVQVCFGSFGLRATAGDAQAETDELNCFNGRASRVAQVVARLDYR